MNDSVDEKTQNKQQNLPRLETLIRTSEYSNPLYASSTDLCSSRQNSFHLKHPAERLSQIKQHHYAEESIGRERKKEYNYRRACGRRTLTYVALTVVIVLLLVVGYWIGYAWRADNNNKHLFTKSMKLEQDEDYDKKDKALINLQETVNELRANIRDMKKQMKEADQEKIIHINAIRQKETSTTTQRTTTQSSFRQIQKFTSESRTLGELKPNPCPGNVTKLIQVIDEDGNLTDSYIQCIRGWVVLQRRYHPYNLNFNRTWVAYLNGFGDMGDINGELWLGLKTAETLLDRSHYKLRFEALDRHGKFQWLEYADFRLSDQANAYRMHVKLPVSGTMGDVLNCYDGGPENGMGFSTFDKDHDEVTYGSCAPTLGAGWWYRKCSNIDFNSNYVNKIRGGVNGHWIGFYDCTARKWRWYLKATAIMMKMIE